MMFKKNEEGSVSLSMVCGERASSGDKSLLEVPSSWGSCRFGIAMSRVFEDGYAEEAGRSISMTDQREQLGLDK